jgi:hypothetical protein
MSSTLGYSLIENIGGESLSDEGNLLDKRRQNVHARTQKKRESFITSNNNNKNKLSPAILEQMHNRTPDDEEDGAFLPPPQSAGVANTIQKEKEKEKEEEEKTKKTESMVNMTNETMFRTLGRPPEPTYGSDNNLYLND